jgi:hypothetical protein
VKHRLLQLETVLVLILAWVIVFLFTRRLAAWIKRPGGEAPLVSTAIRHRAAAVCARLQRVARRLPWHSTCLVLAMAGMLLLRRRGIVGAVIRFGVRKRNGVLEAHAWLLLGDTILLGGEEIDSYAPLADLCARGTDGS